MTLSIGKLPPSSLGIDTSGAFTAADARAAFAMGKRFFLGCIGLPDVSEDCSAERIASACAAGLAVGLYGFYRSGSWSADTGAFDARLHIDRTPKNVPDGGLVCCDLELPGGPPPLPDALLAYLRAYLAVRRTDPRKLAAGLYVGRVPLSAAQIAALGFDVLYHSGMDGTPEGAGLVYHLEQLRAVPGKTMNVRLPGVSVPVDLDVLHSGDVPWIVDPSVFREDGAPSTEQPPAVRPSSPPPVTAFARRLSGVMLAHAGCSAFENVETYTNLVVRPADRVPAAHAYFYLTPPSTCGLAAAGGLRLAGRTDAELVAKYRAGTPGANADTETVAYRCNVMEQWPAGKPPSNALPFREGDSWLIGPEVHQGVCVGDAEIQPDGSWVVECVEGGQSDGHGYSSAVQRFTRTFRWQGGRLMCGARYVIGVERWSRHEEAGAELPTAPATKPDRPGNLPGLISSADDEERGTLPSQPSPAPAPPAAKPPDQARPPTPAPPAAPAKPVPALPAPPKRPIAAPAVSVGAIFTAAGAVLAWAQAHPWLAGGGVALAAFVAIVVWELRHRAQARAHEAAANAKRTDDLKTIHDRLDEQEKTMSQISDQLAQVQASLTAAQGSLTTVSSEVQALDAEIQKLQAQIAAGSSQLDPADASALAALVTQSAAVASQASAAAAAAAPPTPAPPPAPPPAAEPAK